MARLRAAAALTYLLGGLVLTMTVNVPMNETLALVVVPASRAEAGAIWTAYSDRWQLYNQLRTVASGAGLLLAATGLAVSGRRLPEPAAEAVLSARSRPPTG